MALMCEPVRQDVGYLPVTPEHAAWGIYVTGAGRAHKMLLDREGQEA